MNAVLECVEPPKEKEMFRLLVVDSSTWRTNALRVKSETGIPYHLKIVSKKADLQGALQQHRWDVVLCSGYLDVWANVTNGLDQIVGAYRHGNVGVVLSIASLHREGKEMCDYLTLNKVPNGFMPFIWQSPSTKVLITDYVL